MEAFVDEEADLEEADIQDVVDVPCQRHPTVDENSQIADTVNGLKIDVRHPHPGTTAMMQTTAGAQPYQLRLRRVETELELIQALTLSMHADIREARTAASCCAACS